MESCRHQSRRAMRRARQGRHTSTTPQQPRRLVPHVDQGSDNSSFCLSLFSPNTQLAWKTILRKYLSYKQTNKLSSSPNGVRTTNCLDLGSGASFHLRTCIRVTSHDDSDHHKILCRRMHPLWKCSQCLSIHLCGQSCYGCVQPVGDQGFLPPRKAGPAGNLHDYGHRYWGWFRRTALGSRARCVVQTQCKRSAACCMLHRCPPHLPCKHKRAPV